MSHDQPRFPQLGIKTMIVHTVTYFAMGVLALSVLDYATLYARPDMAGLMRQTTVPMVWVNHPQKRWLTWVMAVAFVLVMVIPVAGLLAKSPGA